MSSACGLWSCSGPWPTNPFDKTNTQIVQFMWLYLDSAQFGPEDPVLVEPRGALCAHWQRPKSALSQESGHSSQCFIKVRAIRVLVQGSSLIALRSSRMTESTWLAGESTDLQPISALSNRSCLLRRSRSFFVHPFPFLTISVVYLPCLPARPSLCIRAPTQSHIHRFGQHRSSMQRGHCFVPCQLLYPICHLLYVCAPVLIRYNR